MSAVAARVRPAEELANTLSHGAGALVAVAAVVAILLGAVSTGDPWRVVSVAVHGLSLLLVLGVSTAYHAVRGPRAKRVLRVLDHCAIYILIAGTYTPFTLVSLRGPWGWSLFGTVWGLAVLGVVLKAVDMGRMERVSTALYLAMGWLCVVAAGPLVQALPAHGLAWLVAGGLAYTAGVAFFVWERLPYNHLVWHLFVLLGAACHLVAVHAAVA